MRYLGPTLSLRLTNHFENIEILSSDNKLATETDQDEHWVTAYSYTVELCMGVAQCHCYIKTNVYSKYDSMNT